MGNRNASSFMVSFRVEFIQVGLFVWTVLDLKAAIVSRLKLITSFLEEF